MADQLYLSYWLRGFSEGNMQRKFERLLRTFPFSTASTTVTTLRIYAMEYAEPPLLEVSFASPTAPEEIVEAAAQFQNGDCAFPVERRLLWTESGENFAEKLRQTIAAPGL
jgi:hypothetical protein